MVSRVLTHEIRRLPSPPRATAVSKIAAPVHPHIPVTSAVDAPERSATPVVLFRLAMYRAFRVTPAPSSIDDVAAM